MEITSCRSTAWPLAEEIVKLAVRVEQPVRAVVHQDSQPQLPSADDDQRKRRGKQPKCPVRLPSPSTSKSGEHNHDPGVRNQPYTTPIRQCGNRLPVFVTEYLARIGGLYRRHSPGLFMDFII